MNVEKYCFIEIIMIDNSNKCDNMLILHDCIILLIIFFIEVGMIGNFSKCGILLCYIFVYFSPKPENGKLKNTLSKFSDILVNVIYNDIF